MIPRIIHRVWVGSPLPGHLAAYGRTWEQHHPGWDSVLWGDDDLHWLEHRDLYDAAPDLVPADAVGQLRADIARYEILLAHGGLYVDTDTEALANVEHRLDGHAALAAAEDTRWVGNTYLAAEPGHPVMADLVAGLRRSIGDNPGARPNVTTGPQYLTPTWRLHGCHVDPSHLWFPYSYRDLGRPRRQANRGDAVAVHHWQHQRDLRAAR